MTELRASLYLIAVSLVCFGQAAGARSKELIVSDGWLQAADDVGIDIPLFLRIRKRSRLTGCIAACAIPRHQFLRKARRRSRRRRSRDAFDPIASDAAKTTRWCSVQSKRASPREEDMRWSVRTLIEVLAAMKIDQYPCLDQRNSTAKRSRAKLIYGTT